MQQVHSDLLGFTCFATQTRHAAMQCRSLYGRDVLVNGGSHKRVYERQPRVIEQNVSVGQGGRGRPDGRLVVAAQRRHLDHGGSIAHDRDGARDVRGLRSEAVKAPTHVAGHGVDTEALQPSGARRTGGRPLTGEFAQQLAHEERVASRGVMAGRLELGRRCARERRAE